MLKFLSKKMKKNISIISLACFIFSPLSYLHMNSLKASSPPLPDQIEKQSPQKKPPVKPNKNKPKPSMNRPAPKPNMNKPKPSMNRPARKPNMNKPKPPMNRPAPKSNMNKPKPPMNRPVAKPNMNKPKPPMVKPGPKPDNKFKPPMVKPGPKPDNKFKPPMVKPGLKPDNKFKPPMVKPGPKPDNKFKPPMVKPGPKPDNKFKPPMAKPRPKPDNKFKPPMVKPGPKPDNKFKRPIINKTVQNFKISTSSEIDEDVKDDKPSLWERVLAGVLFTKMSFIQDNAKLSSELNDIGFNCAGLDINYPDKYVQVYCNNYTSSNSNHIDYYLDKTSIEVLEYNPPYYIIKVNEIDINENNIVDKQLNTWEFKYNIDAKIVEFKNIYGNYHYKYKNSNYLDIYTTEPDIVAMAEMAFYMAYNIRFFNNELESFYNVETL